VLRAFVDRRRNDRDHGTARKYDVVSPNGTVSTAAAGARHF